MNLALNNLQRLICYKTQTNKHEQLTVTDQEEGHLYSEELVSPKSKVLSIMARGNIKQTLEQNGKSQLIFTLSRRYS